MKYIVAPSGLQAMPFAQVVPGTTAAGPAGVEAVERAGARRDVAGHRADPEASVGVALGVVRAVLGTSGSSGATTSSSPLPGSSSAI